MMQKNKLAPFIFKSVVFGLAAAFIILILRPDLLGQGRPVVELNEAAPPARFNLSNNLTGGILFRNGCESREECLAFRDWIFKQFALLTPLDELKQQGEKGKGKKLTGEQ